MKDDFFKILKNRKPLTKVCRFLKLPVKYSLLKGVVKRE